MSQHQLTEFLIVNLGFNTDSTTAYFTLTATIPNPAAYIYSLYIVSYRLHLQPLHGILPFTFTASILNPTFMEQLIKQQVN